MKRIAILGGGISGLAAAYELELARRRGAAIDWHLYEASDRLGGILETTRIATPEGNFILEGGPDGWVTEKPWARDLAIELGLESDLIHSNDATRKTYILIDGKLQPMPDRMRMMVPEDLSALEGSPLFSAEARAAYAAELTRATELKASAPEQDESVATFVLRHFGTEVLDKLAAPLLSGVFGGDVAKLSVRSVMPAFVSMEREHGSLIAALQAKAAARGDKPQQPTFTSLRNGMGSLVEAIIAALPIERLHNNVRAKELLYEVYPDSVEWSFWIDKADVTKAQSAHGRSKNHIGMFDHLIMATSLDSARTLLGPWDPVETTLLPSNGSFTSLAPRDASSAILAAFTWPAETAAPFTIPPGFGFLVPPENMDCHPERSEGSAFSGGSKSPLLACTFVDQKFPYRAPPGARILRAFFGGASAEALSTATDANIAQAALTQLRAILGPIPNPSHTEVRSWPRSLPQYEVGHLDRMAQLDALVARIGNLTLLGNSYRGVGVPDLIRDARNAARALAL
jgi:oxygen-dependent protoporphyrinogen oxidase